MKTLIYPKSVNPYLELLYAPMRAVHPDDTFAYLPASPVSVVLFPAVAAVKRLQGYKNFHLHWHAFYLDKKYGIPGRKFISLVNTVVALTALKVLGYNLVWTVHNVLPHEKQTSNDRFVTRLTARFATHVIVHSTEAINELRSVGADTSRAVVNPHGNYAGMYAVQGTREAARAQFGFKPQDTVILFFGIIRPYKGVEQLVDAFRKLKQPGVKLLIAGRCLDDGLRQRLQRAASRNAAIIFHEGNVPDEGVAAHFQAADIACMPFTTVTTSGSVLLAATFGKPLVAPRMGAIKDLPTTAGVLYDPEESHALLRALERAVSDPKKRAIMAKASAAYAKSLNWATIAAKTYQLYK